MAYHVIPACQWSTSSFGQSEDTALEDLSALHAHLELCQRSRRSAFFLRGAASELGAFMLSRVISTVFIATLLLVGLLRAL